jgi:hypothetical protein
LHLAKPSEPRGQRLPIDVLFGSLARELGDRAIGVVFSGMGSDGTQGLQAIKTQGGLTLAQQPESAQFDSMPKSAIAAGCVDIIALPADMPLRILSVRDPAAPSALPVPRPSRPPHWTPSWRCCMGTRGTIWRCTSRTRWSAASPGASPCMAWIRWLPTPPSCARTRRNWTCCSRRC